MTWKSLFPFAVWNIWLNRNWNNYENTNLSLNLNRGFQLALEYKFLTEREVISPTRHPIRISWDKPKGVHFKLNIDGAFKEYTANCDLGGVFRDSNGHWVMDFQLADYASSPLQAELLALREGLWIAVAPWYKPLEVETDSTVVINCLEHGNIFFNAIFHM